MRAGDARAGTNARFPQLVGEMSVGQRGPQHVGATLVVASATSNPVRSKEPVKITTMLEVQATEAKARLAELLRTVERGETVVITRHGKKIAHLVPAAEQERAERREAIEEFKRLRSQLGGINMSIEEILEARHAGHRV